MFNKLKQFKDLRSEAKKLQSELATEEVSVEKDGIVLKMNGNQEVISLSIPSSLDAATIEKALPGMINDAMKKIQRVIAMKMKSGDFNIPNFQ